MDLAKLKADWASDPGLRALGFDTVEELADHLVNLHKTMVEGGAGPYGYLYRQQIRRIRELQRESRRERK